jgi:ribose transport system substrate-binding protein
MRRWMLVAAVVVAFGVLGPTGVGSEAAPRLPQRITLCWTPPDITGVFKTATDFFEKAAAEARQHGIPVQVVSRAPAAHTEFATQVAIIEDFIQRRCSVIAISPIEVEVIIPAIRKANAARIPVIIVNLLEPIRGVQVASYIGFDNTVAAMVSAYSLVDYFGGPGVLGTGPRVSVRQDQYLDLAWWQQVYRTFQNRGDIRVNVGVIEGIAGGFFSTARVNGFRKVVSAFPNIRILDIKPADWNREKGRRVAEDYLTRWPTGLDAIWAASNEMGLGAMLAAEAVGRLELAQEGPRVGDEKVAIFTNDVTPESTARIGEGKIVAETHHGFPEWGWYGTKFGVMLALGQQVPRVFDIRPRTVYGGNHQLFYPNPKLEPIDWEAIKRAARVR